MRRKKCIYAFKARRVRKTLERIFATFSPCWCLPSEAWCDKQHDNLHRESQLSLINFAYRWPHLAPESAIMAAKASMDEIEVLPFLRTSWYTSAFQKDASVLFSLFSSLPHGKLCFRAGLDNRKLCEEIILCRNFHCIQQLVAFCFVLSLNEKLHKSSREVHFVEYAGNMLSFKKNFYL